MQLTQVQIVQETLLFLRFFFLFLALVWKSEADIRRFQLKELIGIFLLIILIYLFLHEVIVSINTPVDFF